MALLVLVTIFFRHCECESLMSCGFCVSSKFVNKTKIFNTINSLASIISAIMDLRRGFVFDKCFCCNKNFNVSQLIELNTNSIVIGETETLTLNELLLDVCFLSVSNEIRIF